MTSDQTQDPHHSKGVPSSDVPSSAERPHNFDAQKEIHQRIRNDPDYDDWEYGTEPLPHEAWLARQQDARGGGAAS